MIIEHGTFTPLVFSVSVSIGKEYSMFHQHMTQKITSKTCERYEKIMSIIRYTLSFLISQSRYLCIISCYFCIISWYFLLPFIRGSRSLQKSELVDDFAIAKFKVEEKFFQPLYFYLTYVQI